MIDYGPNIYTEPSPSDDTLANLGPLRPMAGVCEGVMGADEDPRSAERNATLVERYELQPIDAQTNGPQLFDGLRYHTHIVKPGEVETFHDQVGYWLWEPAARAVTPTLAIPRARCCSDPDRRRPADGYEIKVIGRRQVDRVGRGPIRRS